MTKVSFILNRNPPYMDTEVPYERAKAEDRTEPNWSNTVEMLLRKGVRNYRTKI